MNGNGSHEIHSWHKQHQMIPTSTTLNNMSYSRVTMETQTSLAVYAFVQNYKTCEELHLE